MRFTVSLTYNETELKNGDKAVEHRLLSIDKGSNYNRMTVSYSGLTQPVDVASGVVIHSEDTETLVVDKNCVLYADPTDNPKGQNFQIYVGAFFPEGNVETRKVLYPESVSGAAGHALGIRKSLSADEKFTYYFGSSWSKYDCRNMAEWILRTANQAQALKSPLTVTFGD